MKTLFRILLLFIVVLFVTSFTKHRSKRYALSCVVIDAGHGGHDSGCLGKKTKEKDVSLSIALKLGKYIESHCKGVKVIYTRKTDVFLELHERVAIANNAKADLFICVHCNSASVHDVYGPETWVMGLHKSQANLEVSKRENEVVLLEKDYLNKYDGFDPNSPEANIIFSLYQNTYLDQSLRMASLVQQEMKVSGRSGRGVKQAGFLVLYKTSMPSILFESGFLTNPGEEKYLATSKGQDEIAHSIFAAFSNYKNSVESVYGEDEEENKVQDECQDQPVRAIKSLDEESPDTTQQTKSPEKPHQEKSKLVPVKFQVIHKEEKKSGRQDGVIFSIQVVFSPKLLPLNSTVFKGEKDISFEKTKDGYKYRTGSFASFGEAVRHQAEMRRKGFADAFVVAFQNGTRITIGEAKESLQKK